MLHSRDNYRSWPIAGCKYLRSCETSRVNRQGASEQGLSINQPDGDEITVGFLSLGSGPINLLVRRNNCHHPTPMSWPWV